MALLSLLSFTSEARLRELAHQVAARCQPAVQSRVAGRLSELQLSEARGYVRARSSSIIRHEVEQLIRQQPKLRHSQRQLQALASDAAIRQVVWQMLSERKKYQSAAVAARRAA